MFRHICKHQPSGNISTSEFLRDSLYRERTQVTIYYIFNRIYIVARQQAKFGTAPEMALAGSWLLGVKD